MTDATASALSKDVPSTQPRRKMTIPKESFPGERRVALAPANVAAMQKLGFDVFVENGAGLASGFADEDYAKAGAQISTNARDLFSSADVILKQFYFSINYQT
jgi:NAD(P) transhydrogenase